MTEQAQQIYHSFLVRCWLVLPAMDGERPLWRFELCEVVGEAEKHAFSDLEKLQEFVVLKLAALAAGRSAESENEELQKGVAL